MLKVIIASICVLLFGSQAKAQEQVSDKKDAEISAETEEKIVFFDENGEEVFYENIDGLSHYKDASSNPVNGKVIRKFPNGQVMMQFFCENGYISGTNKSYYENGKLNSESEFKEGKLHGLSKSYHRDGWLLSDSNYKDGVLEGLARMYNKNGRVTSKVTFKNGKFDGASKMYNDDGELMSETTYKDGIEVDSKIYINGKPL